MHHRDKQKETQRVPERGQRASDRDSLCQHGIPQPLDNEQMDKEEQGRCQQGHDNRTTGGSTPLEILLGRVEKLLVESTVHVFYQMFGISFAILL